MEKATQAVDKFVGTPRNPLAKDWIMFRGGNINLAEMKKRCYQFSIKSLLSMYNPIIPGMFDSLQRRETLLLEAKNNMDWLMQCKPYCEDNLQLITLNERISKYAEAIKEMEKGVEMKKRIKKTIEGSENISL